MLMNGYRFSRLEKVSTISEFVCENELKNMSMYDYSIISPTFLLIIYEDLIYLHIEIYLGLSTIKKGK